MSYRNRWLEPVEYTKPINGLSHPFFERIQRGDLATAAEIAGALIEVLKFKQKQGEEVSVPLSQWKTRQELLNVLLNSQK
jgi:hypothetical protein